MADVASSAPSLAWSGTLHRSGLWTFYVTMVLISTYTNTSFLFSIWRLKEKRTSTDILIAGVSIGILAASAECLPQCFANLIGGTFVFGLQGCWLQSFIHIIGLQIQFFAVSAIAYRTYVGVVKLRPFPQDKALKIIVAIFCISCAGTGLFGAFSTYALSASGTFCFYGWLSPALVAWAWPTFSISAILMGYWYWQTFATVRAVRRAAKNILIDGSRKDADIAMKLATLVLLFVGGYCLFLTLSIYEMINGRSSAGLDISAVLFGLIYWVVVPFAYGFTNTRLGLWSAIFFHPYGSSTQKANSKADNNGVLSTAETKMEMSALTTAKDAQSSQKIIIGSGETILLNDEEDDRSPRSPPRSPTSGNQSDQSPIHDSLGSSRAALIPHQDSLREVSPTPDSMSTTGSSSLPQLEAFSESPLIFNPFTTNNSTSDLRNRADSTDQHATLNPINEVSPRSISILEGSTPHEKLITPIAAPSRTTTTTTNFRFPSIAET